MPDALEIINTILSQHFRITENVKTAGERMNDIDAIFRVQVTAYKAAQSAFPVANLIERRDQLLKTIDVLADGLNKHFAYEEKVLPLVFGELVMKKILHDHSEILERIVTAKTTLSAIDGLSRDQLLSERLGLMQNINDLSDAVVNHARYEEEVLNATQKAFEAKKAG